MDFFKLFFNHDQRLDSTAKRNANKTAAEVEATLHDFMSPTPTFSKFYLSGTRLKENLFGLSRLHRYREIVDRLQHCMTGSSLITPQEKTDSLSDALHSLAVGEPLVITKKPHEVPALHPLAIDDDSNVGHLKDELREVLLAGHQVWYKEKAHDGFDLHLFSRQNTYPALFEAFKPLIGPDFRFFSINSKRMRSEKHFYFETWTLDRPPHGAEEVFADTQL